MASLPLSTLSLGATPQESNPTDPGPWPPNLGPLSCRNLLFSGFAEQVSFWGSNLTSGSFSLSPVIVSSRVVLFWEQGGGAGPGTGCVSR